VTGRLVAWSARRSRSVIVAALLLALLGELARRSLARDVIPDLADPQLAILADWMGHPASDVASDVTRVLEVSLDGVAGVVAVRGQSMTGMAYLDVVFASADALVAGRPEIVTRVEAARRRLPATARVRVGPAVSSTSWVFQYAIFDPTHGQPLRELRRLQTQVLVPALAAIPGVAEVATVGGGERDVLVEVHSDAIAARALAFSDVVAAVHDALASGQVSSAADLATQPVAAPAGAVRVGDVARIRRGNQDMHQTGVANLDGQSAAMGGIVIAQRDAKLPELIEAVRAALERQRSRLPPGVRLVVAYDRLDLIDRVGRTLLHALAEEVAVVVLAILIFLLHARSALIPLCTLPIVLLLTFAGMWLLGVPATIMSLGGIGIALGMAVDADVVALETCHRRLEALGPGAPEGERRVALSAASGSIAPALLTSLLIAALSFLPVLAFVGETGRLLRPLALTKTLVVMSAALVTLTLAPALRDRLLRGRVVAEMANPLTRTLVRLYRPFVQFALARPVLTLVTAGLAVISCLPLLSRLGGEFLPRVDEGDLLFMPTTLPGVESHRAENDLRRQGRAIAAFKEVGTVLGKLGRADTATDPAPVSMIETTIHLAPRAEWPLVAHPRWYSGWAPAPARRALAWLWPEESPPTTTELIHMMDRATRLPGWAGAWTAPIRARMDMMSTGVRTPVGIRVVAPDVARLDALGAQLQSVAAQLPGTRSAVFESLGGESRLLFELDGGALARREVDGALARAIADHLLARGEIGQLHDNGQTVRVRVIPDENVQGPADELRDATVRSSPRAGGPSQPVPLALVGHVRYATRPAMIRTERGELAAYIYIDLDEGMDPRSFVERARRVVDGELAAGRIALGAGERIDWVGQYQLLEAGARRLRWIVPAVGLSMLVLLFLQFRSLVGALIVLASVPFALVGSFWTLFLLGYALSAPVWVGLLSVVGLAMQTGVVMVVYIDAAFYRRVRAGKLRTRDDIIAAHTEGTVQRLRPKLMTITTMAVSLLPLLWAEGAGAEVMRRVAAPMVGGLATSAFLTLEVLPVLYTIWRIRQLQRATRLGTAIDAVLTRPPPWAL
jgi:Cu(I)/Ag(I) efflux system membrane protein CusA/SilA